MTQPHRGGERLCREQFDTLLQHYRNHFIELIKVYAPDLSIGTVGDIGTGDGWLAVALALFTPHHVIALDMNPQRLWRTRRFAQMAGVADRIEWISASVNRLPFSDRAIDVAFCVEVLEHTTDQRNAVRELARVTRQLLVVSTPNQLFPILGHDTKLPFCHWLPLNWRDRYANVMGRRDQQEGNRFLLPVDLTCGLAEFRRVSAFLQFPSYAAYRKAGEYPAGCSPAARFARSGMNTYLASVGRIGYGGMHLMPNLASAWLRQKS
jgi:SAM-dependent methyltransferase